jgi:hypothetical protein
MNFIDFRDFLLKYVVCNDVFYMNVQSNFFNSLPTFFDQFLHKIVKN